MIYIVHNTGEYIRNTLGYTKFSRWHGNIKQYTSLDEMNEIDKDQFGYMISEGISVTNSENIVWQIRNN